MLVLIISRYIFLFLLFSLFSLILILCFEKIQGKHGRNFLIADVEENSDSCTRKGRTEMNLLKLQVDRFQLKTKKTLNRAML